MLEPQQDFRDTLPSFIQLETTGTRNILRRDTNQAQAEIYWQGGFLSRVQLQRCVRSYRDMENYGRFWERVTELRNAGYSAERMAATLNSEKFATPKNKRFSAQQVMLLLKRKGLGSLQEAKDRSENEWTLHHLADELAIAIETLRGWAKHGWVEYRQTPTQRFYVIWADESELDRLRRLAKRTRKGNVRHSSELTTPTRKQRTTNT